MKRIMTRMSPKKDRKTTIMLIMRKKKRKTTKNQVAQAIPAHLMTVYNVNLLVLSPWFL